MDYSRIGSGPSNSTGFSNLPKLSAFIQPPLNRFFIPRPSLAYKKPLDRAPDERVGCRHSSVSSFLNHVQQSYYDTVIATNGHSKDDNAKLDKVTYFYLIS